MTHYPDDMPEPPTPREGPTQAQMLAARIPAEFIKAPPQGKFGKYVIQDEPGAYFSHEQYAKFYLATYKAAPLVRCIPECPVSLILGRHAS